MMDKIQEHFRSIFWYIVGMSGVIMLYVASVTFLPIPKENQRFVDIAFGFLLNVVAQGVGYLTGGSPLKKDSSSDKPAQ
jgi:hypothetical protein